MKIIKIITLITFFSINLNAQKAQPDINEINMRLKKNEEEILKTNYKLENFRYQHNVGISLQFGGAALIGLGSYANYRYYKKNNSIQGVIPPGNFLIILGSLSSCAGFIIELNSYKHLKLK
jgi:hypothetical protein